MCEGEGGGGELDGVSRERETEAETAEVKGVSYFRVLTPFPYLGVTVHIIGLRLRVGFGLN